MKSRDCINTRFLCFDLIVATMYLSFGDISTQAFSRHSMPAPLLTRYDRREIIFPYAHRRQARNSAYDSSFIRRNHLHRHNSAIFVNKNNHNKYSGSNRTASTSRQSRKKKTLSTFSTAVCIVPPDETWDSIQRARHLARDTSFYKWPPAIRLFHPFAPKSEIPSHVGRLAEWIDEEGLSFELSSETDDIFPFLSPFEVTLDSLQILPHWEVLDAQKDVQENQMNQQGLGETLEEKRFRKQKEASQLLIEDEAKKGIIRKKEREKKELVDRRRKLKRELKQKKKEVEMGIDHNGIKDIMHQLEEVQLEIDHVVSMNTTFIEENVDEQEDTTSDEAIEQKFEGPCVIYLAPSQQSTIALKELREKLLTELFSAYEAFSPSSSVSSYPEFLPRKALSDQRELWRPLLPIARFPSVKEAVKIAKVLQKSWQPLEFNVTDIQFISRNDNDFANSNNGNFEAGTGFGGRTGKKGHTTASMAITTSGEVEDISKQGVFGCDAMVMLLGEEPEEACMEDDATLSMIVTGEGDTSQDKLEYIYEDLATASIDYNSLFTKAEREYQRMESHEEYSSAEFLGDVPIFSGDEDLEKWLESDDNSDEGATVVLGRAQFFMGAMREFVGMPVSSVIDYKERIMGGGVNSAARKKGPSKSFDSWDANDSSIVDQDEAN